MTPARTAVEAPVQRSSARPVSRPHDPHEHEADRAADVVARGGSVAAWSFSAVPASAQTPVQRQEKPKTDEEKRKEALTKAGEAALETPVGKALKEKVLADPVVKAVSDAIASPGGLAAIGVGVGALAVAGEPLPVQPPTLKLDRITPGLSADITWKGPVAAPTQVGLVLTYKEQGPKARPKKSATEKYREETARLAAADAAFRRGMTSEPGTKEAEERKADEEAIQRYVTSRIGALPGFGSPLIGLSVPPPQQPEAAGAEERKKPDDAPVQRSASAAAREPASATYDTSVVDAAVATPGSALEAPTRRYMESRFGYDFSAVRVHADPASAGSALALDADAYTAGRHIVFAPGRYDPASARGRRLIAHELAHVVQQGTTPVADRGGAAGPIHRKVIVGGAEMTDKERAAFLRARKWANAGVAKAVLDDMAAAQDPFDFTDTAELTTEVVKRTSTSVHIQESQVPVPADKNKAFGYPFSGDAALYGPRVNYAAREFWKPAPPDDYAVRTDKEKNKQLIGLPRNQRHTVYGDMGYGYSWVLTDKGRKDCHSAVALLFVGQPAHRRALLHCDYLISLVNFLSLADSIGKDEFNKRIAAWGADKIVLRSLLFTDLEPLVRRAIAGGAGTTTAPGLKSTQAVVPSSEADLVIGDHVMFFNHLGYDLVNESVGNAWRLENAVLIERLPKGADVFLGHGSGRKTAATMRDKLKEEFNDVARLAIALTQRAGSKSTKDAAAAKAELARRFRHVKLVSGEWRIVGAAPLARDTGCTVQVDEKLREIKRDDVVGLKHPCDQKRLYPVRRPIESAKGRP